MRYIVITIFLNLLCYNNFGQRLNIKILSDQTLTSFIFSPVVGKYHVLSDSIILYTLKKNDVINLSIQNDSIVLKTLDHKVGVYKNIRISGAAKTNYAKLKSVNQKSLQRLYDDDLIVSIENNKFFIINNVELENYVSGVVESEGGQKASLEYYKTQAVLCRTYALENFNRHILEGFNLCDEVHCQAYKSKSLSNFDIPEATSSTEGLVIVDSTLSLITAGFYSNCGGQTVNSEDVWSTSRMYLKSVIDTFCIHEKNARWSKNIPFDKWKAYLNANGIKIPDSEDNNYRFVQNSRLQYYRFNFDSISLRKIRTDWNLKSTYFSINKVGNEICFNGRGYGHGVGLCQEGAMKMAKLGYDYKKIIQFYYKNTFVVSLEALNFFRTP